MCILLFRVRTTLIMCAKADALIGAANCWTADIFVKAYVIRWIESIKKSDAENCVEGLFKFGSCQHRCAEANYSFRSSCLLGYVRAKNTNARNAVTKIADNVRRK